MSKKAYIIISITLFFIVVILLIFHKNELEKFTEQGIKAFEKEQSSVIVNMLSKNYIEQNGLTKKYMKTNLNTLFTQFQNIKVNVSHLKTEKKSANSGIVSFKFTIVATIAPGAKLGRIQNPYGTQRIFLVGMPNKLALIKMSLVKEEGEWKLLDIIDINIGIPLPHK